MLQNNGQLCYQSENLLILFLRDWTLSPTLSQACSMRELAQPQLCYLTIHLSKQITLPLSSLPRVELCELTNQKDDPRRTPSTSFDQQLKFQFFFPKPWSRRKNNPNLHNSAMTLPPHLKVMWQKVTWQLREDLGGNISFIFSGQE